MVWGLRPDCVKYGGLTKSDPYCDERNQNKPSFFVWAIFCCTKIINLSPSAQKAEIFSSLVDVSKKQGRSSEIVAENIFFARPAFEARVSTGQNF